MSKKTFGYSKNSMMKFMWLDSTALTLYNIANSIFNLEKEIKDNGAFFSEVEIDIYIDLNDEKRKRIIHLLNHLVSNILNEEIEFSLNFKENESKIRTNREFRKTDTICLYSGGIDSTSGILISKDKYPDLLGLFVAHQDTTRISHIIDKIWNKILKPKDIEFEKFIAPSMGIGYSQTRGFLYTLYSGILAYFTDAQRVLICECGATMYQPKFSPYDTITYTTNPYVLQIAKEIIELILDREYELIIPFEDMTKTEVMQLLNDDNLFEITHSCITSRWGVNCGRCYACIARMVGSANLGLSLDYFRYNSLNELLNDNLDSYLNFSFNFLLNKEDLDFWSYSNILKFNKENLFERASLDVFNSLLELKKEGKLNPNYYKILNEVIKYKKDEMVARKNELKEVKVPDYEKKVGPYEY